MTFLHTSLLLGGALAAVPIVLHLIMRQRPRRLEFPALRFVQRRQETNRRSIRLRHLLLLALRIAFICLLALALARPSIKASGALGGGTQQPVAAALIFDTAPRMEYQRRNESRLQVAAQSALQLLDGLPRDSQVAVLDARAGRAVFQIDLPAARQRVEKLETSAVHRSLPQRIAAAAELLAASPLERKEIYVFTDRTASAWPQLEIAPLLAQLADLPGAALTVVDVGLDEPLNVSLGPLELSGQVLAQGGTLRLKTEFRSQGTASGPRSVELYLLDAQGNAEKRAEQPVDVPADGGQVVEFALAGLSAGLQQGYVKLVGQGSDGLAFDNQRYFTVDVRPAWKVLLVAPPPAARQALYLAEALAPRAFRQNGQARFQCDVSDYSQWAERPWDDYAALCLLDPPPLPAPVWQQLGGYVAQGRGLAVFLGPQANLQDFNQGPAQELLPGPLALQARFPDGTLALATGDYQHPVLDKFRPIRDRLPWENFPVYRYWQFESLAEDARTILRYTNDKPALLERVVGAGCVLTLTTPVSEDPAAGPAGRWNELPTGFEPWPFVMLSNELLLYLVGSTAETFNVRPGETAVLKLPSEPSFPTYLVLSPHGELPRQPPNAERNEIVITATEWAGNYQVRAGGRETGVFRGLSVNFPAEESDLARLTTEGFAEPWGEAPPQVVRDVAELQRTVTLGRVGIELYPWLIVCVALIFGGEHFLANRFYKEA